MIANQVNSLFKPATVIGVTAASISVAVAIAADVTTFIGHEDMVALAEASWYFQLVQVIMTNLTTIIGFSFIFAFRDGAPFVFEMGIPFFVLVSIGICFGIIFGIAGSVYVIASLGLWNYTLYGVEGEFDGEEILDEIALSISY